MSLSPEDLRHRLEEMRRELDQLKRGGVGVVEKLANPAPLGLAGFGLTTLILNIVNADLIAKAGIGMVLPVGLFYGGLAQFLAGMWEMKKNNTFGFTAFSSFGAFWMALAIMVILEDTKVIAPVPKSGMSVFLGAWGLFTAYMTIGTLKISRALLVVFATLTILFFLLACGEHNETVLKVAGWEGIFCAFTALYASAAQVINETWGEYLLPLGLVKK
ncbi:MAG: acetate uptake transporter [Dehalococcoidia bacterium]